MYTSSNHCSAVPKSKEARIAFSGKLVQRFSMVALQYQTGRSYLLPCAKSAALKLVDLSKNAEQAFVTIGFNNWKKALEKFNKHQNSSAHAYSVKQLAHHKASKPIDSQLWQQVKKQQDSWFCLNKIIHTIALLAKQGLALRGHDDKDGNFRQVLEARADDVPCLKQRITSSRAEYLSPDIQNEVLQLLSHAILRILCNSIGDNPFAVIVDGTQDISGQEQECFCIRYVDQDLWPHEDFIGLYQAEDTSGASIANIVKDVLCRQGLSLAMLRAQTYDGAANMAGKYHGAQAIIRQQQPLALYVHCGAHCTNLVIQAAAQQCSIMEDAILYVQELGNLFGQSMTCRTKFADIVQQSTEGPAKVAKIKPLLPTRWTVRVKAVQKVMDNYEAILETLEEMAASKNSGDVPARARGLLKQFQEGITFLGLQIVVQVMQLLECLNIAMQGNQQTVSGLLASVNHTHSAILKLRNEQSFDSLLMYNNNMVTKCELKEIELPRRRHIPKRIDEGLAENVHPRTIKDYYRPQYFELLDTVSVQLKQRFDQGGIQMYEHIEQLLLTGRSAENIVKYPEIEYPLFSAQLTTLSSVHKYSSISELVEIFRRMPCTERAFFAQVEKLLRILLTVPVSSCEAERSFSALRRLKTWLRTTMTQKRLNHVCVCNILKDIIDLVDIQTIAKQFIMRTERRKKIFVFLDKCS
ncbi:zinc finger MYM-type protein 1-like [Ambystoma mexicanum]|uniref:zinc finger MYM-type protein 1-like n=1 Tax=Ambystoma mexicanum TaxID=8296 RepID=UPI0037E92B4A